MDDLLAFSNDKRHLAELRNHLVVFLRQFRLKLHPDKSVVFPTKCGIPFLGYRIFPTHRLLGKDNVKRFRHRMRRLQGRYEDRQISIQEVGQRIASWLGHAGHANTYRLRTRLLGELRFCRSNEAGVREDATHDKSTQVDAPCRGR